MRTAEGWRFTAWVAMNGATRRVDWTKTVAHELYDLRADRGDDFDFDAYSVNVAAKQPQLVATMHDELKAAVESWY